MFEIVEYMRKLMLTGVLSIIAAPGSAIQSLVGVVMTFFSFALASAWLPFATDEVRPNYYCSEAYL